MRGEDETMDLHSHCCRCHTVSLQQMSNSHACGREEEVRALSQAKRKNNKKKGAKGEHRRFRVSTSRLLAQTLPTSVFFRDFCTSFLATENLQNRFFFEIFNFQFRFLATFRQ
jgi:hypothetical protein